MSWVPHRPWLLETARAIDKSVILITKDHWFWSVLGAILAFFRMMTKEEFLELYATTIGPIQAYPSSWSLEAVRQVMIHETQHTKQCRICSLFLSPYLGLPVMGILYGLFPLPIGLAWARYRFELDASRKEWQWMLRHGIREEDVRKRAIEFAKTVSSSKYGWAVPRRWALWGFERALKKEIDIFRCWSSRLVST